MKCLCRVVIIRLFVALVTTLSVDASTGNVTYACYPNTTLKVENPGDFTSVFANNSLTICTTTWSPDKKLVYIDGCRMDDDILVYFSYMEPAFIKVIGGTVTDAYSINCAQIPSSGVFKTISNGFEVAIDDVDQEKYYSFDPDFEITSGIFEDFGGTVLATEAIVGTPYFWVVKSNKKKYRIRPLECWAYAGKGILDNVPKRLIYKNGCSIDMELVSDFMTMAYDIHSYAKRAILYTFRFYGSQYVTIECNVRVCPYKHGQSLSFCDTMECLSDRKRRELFDAPDKMEMTVKEHFLVVDPNSSSSQIVASLNLFVVLWVVLVIVCSLTGE